MPCEPDTEVVEFGAATFMSERWSPFWMSTSTAPNLSLRSAFTAVPSLASSSTFAWVSGLTSTLRLPVKSRVAVEATDVQISEPFFSFILRTAATQSLSSGRFTSTVPFTATRVASRSSRLGGSCSGAAPSTPAERTKKTSAFICSLPLRIRIALFPVHACVRDHVEQFAPGDVLVRHAAHDQPLVLALAQRVAAADAEEPHRQAAFDLQGLAEHVGERPLGEETLLLKVPVGRDDPAARQVAGDGGEVGVGVLVFEQRQERAAGVAITRPILLEDP